MAVRWDDWRKPAAMTPEKRRGFHWCRLDNDFIDRPLWRAVAKKARAPVAAVVCVVLRLECLANRSIPRGSVADMSIGEFSASLQLRPTVVARIRACLEEPDISWIEQDFIVDFFQRNPDMSDPTAADRQRRHRAKLREERQRELATLSPDRPATGPPEFSTYPQVTRDTVTVTRDVIHIRSDQIESAAGGKLGCRPVRADARPGLSEEDSGSGARASDPERSVVPHVTAEKHDAASPQLWLAESDRIVTERLQVTPAQARIKIGRWRESLGNDGMALAAIIRAADATDWVGARFHNLVVDMIRKHRRDAEGPPLPLPPTLATRDDTVRAAAEPIPDSMPAVPRPATKREAG